MNRLISILWPSFVVAGIAEAVFFTVFDPQTLYLFGQPVQYSTTATYSIGFFGFWLVCAVSSLFTWYILRAPASEK